jgi:preprotein translocase subunit SecY
MLSWLANAWRVPELRKRVLFTFMILALYRLGSWIPAPGVDSQTIKDYFNGRGGTILGLLNVFSGGALSQFALFALGIMPYVTASIILQLMTVVVPQLEQLQKEGESGYAKINQYTRYLTVALAAAQSTGYAYLFKRAGNLDANTGRIILIVVTLTAGTTLLMWLGELITKRGVGNGISLLIFASILSSAPTGIAACTTAGRWSGCSSRSWPSGSWLPSCSSRKASGASRSSTPSGWSVAVRPRAARRTCRCA